ncbi:MAG: hypothetical protein JNK43_11235 [Ignavibacteria bacterium]|nr:hypothetical protein [Ignavibacteria bacterium]
MRKSLILFILIFVYIWGCSGSEDEYSLIKSPDRKAIAEICGCFEPISVYKKRMTEERDSLLRNAYRDSFELKIVEMAPCIEKEEKLDEKTASSDKYMEQFMKYVKEKHPDCYPMLIGTGRGDSTNINK